MASNKRDLVAFGGDESSPEFPLVQDLGGPGESGELCVGVKKVIQRFLMLFLLPKGSVPYCPRMGSNFMPTLQRGFLRTSFDVHVAFAEAEKDVRTQIVAEETDDDPADERIRKCFLRQVIFSRDGYIFLSVEFNTRAGSSATFFMPTLFRI